MLEASENHVLYAIGDPATDLLDRSARRTAEHMKSFAPGSMESYHLHERIVLMRGDLAYMTTPGIEGLVQSWLTSDDVDLRGMAHRLAELLQSIALVSEAKRRDPTWDELPSREGYAWVDPDSWLKCWHSAEDVAVRRSWLRFFTATPTVEIEDVLLRCLPVPGLAPQAARHLGRIGSQRARRQLRALLKSEHEGARWEAVRALGRLKDSGSIDDLLKIIVRTTEKAHVRQFAAIALGLIQTPEAERALAALLDDSRVAELAATGLLRHGSPSATAHVLGEAERRGGEWLVETCQHAFSFHGRWRRQYYTEVAADDLARFLGNYESECPGPKRRDVLHALEALDGPGVREFFRGVASRRGTSGDPVLRTDSGLLASDVALRELCDRGDDSVVEHFVAEALKDHGHGWYVGDDLYQFSASTVRRELTKALSTSALDPTHIARVLRLLGAHGGAGEEEIIKRYIGHPVPEVADAAREAVLYLSDPLRMPEGWSLLPG